jgi:hypothetical protein
MYHGPEDPTDEAGKVSTKDVRHGGRASDHCERAFIYVLKGRKFWLAFHFS